MGIPSTAIFTSKGSNGPVPLLPAAVQPPPPPPLAEIPVLLVQHCSRLRRQANTTRVLDNAIEASICIVRTTVLQGQLHTVMSLLQSSLVGRGTGCGTTVPTARCRGDTVAGILDKILPTAIEVILAVHRVSTNFGCLRNHHLHRLAGLAQAGHFKIIQAAGKFQSTVDAGTDPATRLVCIGLDIPQADTGTIITGRQCGTTETQTQPGSVINKARSETASTLCSTAGSSMASR